MNQETILQKLDNAIQNLMKYDRDLLIRDVNERSITLRLAMYLQCEFPKKHVDCEFNRDHEGVKKLLCFPKRARTNDTDARTVFPDIIVHERKGPNLLIIEAKKSGKRELKKRCTDLQKLQAFKDELGYEHAVFLVFHTGSNPGVEAPKFV
jgi:hypothetical protein